MGKDPDAYVEEHLGPEVSLPDAYAYLWSFYRRVSDRRGFSDGVANAITFTELEAASRMLGKRLDSWEVRILMGLDDHERQILHEQLKQAQAS